MPVGVCFRYFVIYSTRVINVFHKDNSSQKKSYDLLGKVLDS